MTRPHRVAILVLPSVVPFDLAVPLQVFGYPREDLGARRYRAVVCCERPGLVPSARGIAIHVGHGLGALRSADTIIVPGIDDLDHAIAPVVLRGLQRAYARGARVASICTGSFVLAAAGLLDGRRATTHWIDVPAMRERFPSVQVDPDVLYTEDGRIFTSAGIAAGIDLCLHLVHRDFGVRLANAIARRLVVPPHRAGGQAQYIPEPVAEPTGRTLEPTRAWMLARLGTPLTVGAMAAHAGVPVRTFVRRFRAESGVSPLQWVLRQRVLAAQRMLEASNAPVERIAQRTGFGSPVSLRAHFRRVIGVSPLAYRRTFLRAGSSRG